MRVERKSKKLLSDSIISYPSLNFQPSTLNSQKPVLLETEVGRRTRALATDNDMVEEMDLHEIGRLADAAGQGAIGFARGWVA